MKAHSKDVKIAIQLQRTLAEWQKLHPQDSDAQACSKSKKLVGPILDTHLAEKKTSRKKAVVSKKQKAQISRIRKAISDGDIPPFRKRLFEVLRESDPEGVQLEQVLEALKKKGWAPASKSDQNARTYICAVAGQDNRIVRVSRGVYRLRPRYYKA